MFVTYKRFAVLLRRLSDITQNSCLFFVFFFMSKVLPHHGPARYLVIISSFWSGQDQVQHQMVGILILERLQ